MSKPNSLGLAKFSISLCFPWQGFFLGHFPCFPCAVGTVMKIKNNEESFLKEDVNDKSQESMLIYIIHMTVYEIRTTIIPCCPGLWSGSITWPLGRLIGRFPPETRHVCINMKCIPPQKKNNLISHILNHNVKVTCITVKIFKIVCMAMMFFCVFHNRGTKFLYLLLKKLVCQSTQIWSGNVRKGITSWKFTLTNGSI